MSSRSRSGHTMVEWLLYYSEAERALLPTHTRNHPKDFTEEVISQIPAGGLYILGTICRREHRTETAIEYFKMCLKVMNDTGSIIYLPLALNY